MRKCPGRGPDPRDVVAAAGTGLAAALALGGDANAAEAPPPTCDAGQALLAAGQPAAAVETFVAVLRSDPQAGCASPPDLGAVDHRIMSAGR